MKFFLTIAALSFLAGCADKDEDTGSDTAEAVDTGDSSEE
jgi:type IV pilus biogenesis protein CpaD/CtpE